MTPWKMLILLIVAILPLLEAQVINNKKEPEHIVSSVKQAGGCCGVLDADCGTCTPQTGWPEMPEGYGCCFPGVERRRRTGDPSNGPTYWCCKCGQPFLQPFQGQPCCAGHC